MIKGVGKIIFVIGFGFDPLGGEFLNMKPNFETKNRIIDLLDEDVKGLAGKVVRLRLKILQKL